MAVRYAVANGNWSAVGTWDGGASLPTVGDDVYANGYTVTLDTDINIYVSPTVGNILTSICPTTGIGGGDFAFNSTRNILANIVAGSTVCLKKTSSTAYILTTKYIYGGTGNNAYGLATNANLTLNCEDVYGGSGTNAAGIFTGGHAASINCGVVYGGIGGFGIHNNAGTTNCTSAIAGVKEAINYTTTINQNQAVIVSGSVEASATANAININSGIVQITNGSMKNVGTYQAVYAPKLRITPASSSVWTIQDTDGVDVLLYTSGAFSYPVEANVRSGIVYGTIYTGTCAVPPATAVVKSVPVDNTVGELVTATTPADFIAALKADELGIRLGKCATTEEVDSTAAAYNT